MGKPAFLWKWQYGQKVRKRLRRGTNGQINDFKDGFAHSFSTSIKGLWWTHSHLL